MATAWQDRFTPLENINNGNELQNGDDILSAPINAAIENSAYAKKLADSKILYEHNISITGTASTIKGVGVPDETVNNSFHIYFKFLNKYNTQLNSVSNLINNQYGLGSNLEINILGGTIRIRANGTYIDAGCFNAYKIWYDISGKIRIMFVTPVIFQQPTHDYYYYIPVVDSDTNITISDNVRTLIA